MRTLSPDDLGQLTGSANDDFAWSAAVATFAEILRVSPYASASELDTLATIVGAQAERDSARREFVTLFERARDLLSTSAP